MQDNLKVFSSDITRCNYSLKNDLYSLVKITPAVPVLTHNSENEIDSDCYFAPNTEKHYVPKKKSKLKVKTVRDIRNLFEKDVYSYLPQELEKQQSYLLRKITAGSSRNENTKTLARNLLNGDKPLTRSSWQMITNVNPEGHTYSVQYVLWKGKHIRINGSRGGKHKFLCNYDLSKKKVYTKEESLKPAAITKKGLLRNSLTVKFKPGPLTKKVGLDDSYQKYNVGSVELINLPKPGLEIQPAYGVTLEPRISNFLHSLRDEEGSISDAWAELAASALGSVQNQQIIQSDGHSVTFDLNYKCDQNRLLMRRDVNSKNENNDDGTVFNVVSDSTSGQTQTLPEIKMVMENLLNAVEISLEQDNFYTGIDEPEEETDNGIVKSDSSTVNVRDKVAKRKYCELDRLDVTVIRLPDAPKEKEITNCSNRFCTLGCVCASLQCAYKLKDHCGRPECMFQCKCDFSKFKISESFENSSGLIPGLLNLNNKINENLAKEEKKFHQTVVVSGDQSILLKSEKRNWKASKRYADFYSNMALKSGLKSQPILSVADVKLKCDNIEPWCMVHNLYKCFCKGRFVENSISSKDLESKELNETIAHDINQSDSVISAEKKRQTKCESLTNDKNVKRHSVSDSSDIAEMEYLQYNVMDEHKSARTRPYKGRKYLDSYYSATNNKIANLEKNDDSLRKRMLSLIYPDQGKLEDNRVANKEKDRHDITKNKKGMNMVKDKGILVVDESSNLSSMESAGSDIETKNVSAFLTENPDTLFQLCKNSETEKNIPKSLSDPQEAFDAQTFNTKDLGNTNAKTKLISWLEQSYKLYKQRLDNGLIKKTLEPPKHGKVALYPWNFILSRYRERKNLFLISKKRPYRIFMAVDTRNELFANCMNIDEIRFADLHNYPLTVKNLLTNATNDLKDNFCILCGLSHCWELIGSVTKVKDNETSHTVSTSESGSDPLLMSDIDPSEKDLNDVDNKSPATNNEVNDKSPEKMDIDNGDSTNNSKWFFMTVENDFSEIQFYKRGFFVKYESILKAINVARLSGKTVRLSAQSCSSTNSSPQFGIYAIPDCNEHSVFVGPYDINDNLGINTVRSFKDVRKTNLTRGVWIKTKASDNISVIDNPLAFIPTKQNCSENVVVVSMPHAEVPSSSANTEAKSTEKSTEKITNDTNVLSSENVKSLKVVKPIKIRKTNGFYHLFLKDLKDKSQKQSIPSQLSQGKFTSSTSILSRTGSAVLTPLKKPLPPTTTTAVLPSLLKKSTVTSGDLRPNCSPPLSDSKKPIAEIAPQIKILEVYSESSATITPIKKPIGGMFILKPEEINTRHMENKINSTAPKVPIDNENNIDQDIENFLATSNEYVPPNAEIFEISDDEEDTSSQNNYRDVWIECKNIDNLGIIKGRLNSKNDLSFEFPGFKFTDFYPEEEAFTKINQVFSRKIYVPKNINIEWRVVHSEAELKNPVLLKAEDLGIDFVLTKRGLRHRMDVLANTKSLKLEKGKSSNKFVSKPMSTQEVDLASAIENLDQVEDQSKNLEEEGDRLLSEMTKTNDALFQTFNNVTVLFQEKDGDLAQITKTSDLLKK